MCYAQGCGFCIWHKEQTFHNIIARVIFTEFDLYFTVYSLQTAHQANTAVISSTRDRFGFCADIHIIFGTKPCNPVTL